MQRARVAVIVILALSAISCTTFTSGPFEPTVAGYRLPAPIDTQVLKKAVWLALGNYGWKAIDEGQTFVTARYEKSDGLIRSDIRVDYGSGGYTIQYVDSRNLDLDTGLMTIHRNYSRWIANLNKSVFTFYMSN